MKKYRSFLHWVAATQAFTLAFIHLVLGAMVYSLITDPPEGPWGAVAWVLVLMPLVGYWTGNWWYWVKRLHRGR